MVAFVGDSLNEEVFKFPPSHPVLSKYGPVVAMDLLKFVFDVALAPHIAAVRL